MSLEQRYRNIHGRIPAGVTLVAVSKSQPVDAIQALHALGHRDFGESYAQELLEKHTELLRRGCHGIRWHFIGHLQRNKAKALVPILYSIHSVDSVRLAAELANRVIGRDPLLTFLQVNIDEEATKAGVLPAQASQLAKEVAEFPQLELLGLMCIPAAEVAPQSAFERLQLLELECRPATRGALSMGMSDDFETAIQFGATHVRVGTILFGPREIKP